MIIDEKKILNIMGKKNIKYELYNHPRFKTVKDSIHIRGKIQGSHPEKFIFKKTKKILN
jgi:hypothetical protein|tara:strand:+ start:854 stop:1030 length:177 start_codon:yes stop_codon:yes gene_type:complete